MLLRKSILTLVALTMAMVPVMAENNVDQEVNLFVLVETNQTFYRSGEDVIIEVFTLVGNQFVNVDLNAAVINITGLDGTHSQRNVLPAFQQVGVGHYVARGTADSPGLRKVEVLVSHVPAFSNTIVQSIGYDSYLVDAQPFAPNFLVDIEFMQLPLSPTVCDEIKVTLTVSRYAFVRFQQQMADGSFRDILIPHWLKPGSRWIKFQPEKFDPGNIVFKVIAKDEYGNEAVDFLSVFLDAENCGIHHHY